MLKIVLVKIYANYSNYFKNISITDVKLYLQKLFSLTNLNLKSLISVLIYLIVTKVFIL